MKKIANIIMLIILFGTTISCNGKKEEEWMKFHVNEDEIIYLKINESDSKYIAHWLISGKEDEMCAFGKITFAGKYSELESSGQLILDCNISSNEIKINDGRIISAPVDQNPQLKFDTNNNSLSFYGEVLSKEDNGSKKELEEFLDKFEKWEGDYIPLKD